MGSPAPNGRPPAAPPPAEVVAEGRRLFAAHCAVCHGDEGRGDGPRARFLATRPTDLTDPAWQSRHDDAELAETIVDGTPGTDMPAWKALGRDEIDVLVAFVRSTAR